MEKLTEWQKTIERRLSVLEKTVAPMPEILELDLELPRMDIGGLHFNRQEAKGVFDLKEDGRYCCRSILFLSARNTEDDNSRDILSEYLQSGEVEEAFAAALRNAGIEAGSVEVSLPVENGGMKKYNGADWWYWLGDAYSDSAASFCSVGHYGHPHPGGAASVGGCAPAFRAGERQRRQKNDAV
ncbi:MAG: hypothetical protein LBK61_07890 [Spirochaetaceae bacterium]|jgi:hypothetical protein|nr:hypothetical protein [Spirochaetaceae bacterium]